MAPQTTDLAVTLPSTFASSLDASHAFLHSYDKVLSTSRKLRKSCSLPNCSQRPGECMHCTCDGRCGQHEGGKCGVRREGSGKSCKRLGCPKDETCLHSTRATCCHCRNLVSSQSRSMKAKRTVDDTDSPVMETAAVEVVIAPVVAPAVEKPKTVITTVDKKRKHPVSPLASQTKKKLKVSVKAAPVAVSSSAACGVPSLCEYPEWFRRRTTCNLIVVVEGTQFNLHKFPMLVACPELRAKLQSQDEGVAVLKYAHFPGGAAAFELACIYAYTGHLDINASNVALLYCAARILKMHVNLTSRCATLLESLAVSGSSLDVVHMLLQVVEIRKCLRNQSTDRMMALCVNAIAQRYPYDVDTMYVICKLPYDVFLHITQLILNDKPNATANNVVARLCAQAHLAQVFRSGESALERAAELIKVLEILLSLDQGMDEEEEGEVVENKVEAAFAAAAGKMHMLAAQ